MDFVRLFLSAREYVIFSPSFPFRICSLVKTLLEWKWVAA